MVKKELDLNELSFLELRDKIKELEKQKETVEKKQEGVWIIGEKYFIRTVTMALCGKLVQVTEQELVLESAAWVADTGRFNSFLQDGTPDEVEPFPDGKVIVGRGGLIDAAVWKHDLLRKVK